MSGYGIGGSYNNLTAAELEELLNQNEGLLLLDVRTDAEIARGKIPQGEALPLHLIPVKIGEMDKNRTTVFYCRSGARSAQAAAFFAANGFSDVYNLQGGIISWANLGLPIE